MLSRSKPMRRRPKKDKRGSSEKAYMAWLRESFPNAEIHHCRGLAFGCGMGLKAPDWFGIPLSREMHADFHRLGVNTWEDRYGSQKMQVLAVWRIYGIENIPQEVKNKLIT